MIGEDLRVYVMPPESRPRQKGAAGGNAEKPEVGGFCEIKPGVNSLLPCGHSSDETVVDPKGNKSYPSRIPVSRLKVVMEENSESRMGGRKDCAEHDDDDVR